MAVGARARDGATSADGVVGSPGIACAPGPARQTRNGIDGGSPGPFSHAATHLVGDSPRRTRDAAAGACYHGSALGCRANRRETTGGRRRAGARCVTLDAGDGREAESAAGDEAGDRSAARSVAGRSIRFARLCRAELHPDSANRRQQRSGFVSAIPRSLDRAAARWRVRCARRRICLRSTSRRATRRSSS